MECVLYIILRTIFGVLCSSHLNMFVVVRVQVEHYNWARIDIHSHMDGGSIVCVQSVVCALHIDVDRTWKIQQFRIRCAPNEQTIRPTPKRMHCELSSAKCEWIPLGGKTIYEMLRDCDDSIGVNGSAYANCEAYKCALLPEQTSHDSVYMRIAKMPKVKRLSR